ncbi:MAG: alpha-ketoglutarate-dependent dioxygenase AlkB [Flavobacteriales bacterium]|jgi:alkylated DNA repair dioxygenase AlkB|nr:alpha-ketoglutarate-dependent dioxygenase AlkB [Flavobacteriales bacterium]|tara:strand:- start:150 stop:743 length:594 start_codon:yes stop_codon:yes gene_type:complete
MFNEPLDIKIPDGKIIFHEGFFSLEESHRLMQSLIKTIDWTQDEVIVYGKRHKIPRLNAWYGDEGKVMKYSGLSLEPKTWTKELLEIKSKIEEASGTKFNSCLLNYYRDGKDGMGWHQDNEKELGINPIIASVTFGETRPFQLKHISNKELKKVDIPLSNGSLLTMAGETQHYWKHQIPKTTKTLESRINLTFRQIL